MIRLWLLLLFPILSIQAVVFSHPFEFITIGIDIAFSSNSTYLQINANVEPCQTINIKNLSHSESFDSVSSLPEYNLYLDLELITDSLSCQNNVIADRKIVELNDSNSFMLVMGFDLARIILNYENEIDTITDYLSHFFSSLGCDVACERICYEATSMSKDTILDLLVKKYNENNYVYIVDPFIYSYDTVINMDSNLFYKYDYTIYEMLNFNIAEKLKGDIENDMLVMPSEISTYVYYSNDSGMPIYYNEGIKRSGENVLFGGDKRFCCVDSPLKHFIQQNKYLIFSDSINYSSDPGFPRALSGCSYPGFKLFDDTNYVDVNNFIYFTGDSLDFYSTKISLDEFYQAIGYSSIEKNPEKPVNILSFVQNKNSIKIIINGDTGDLSLGIYNLEGKLIHNFGNIKQKIIFWDVKDAEPGVYFIKATMPQGTYTKKLVLVE
jgi:hypothetical protein